MKSGEARFRIEHGHLYDPFFVAYPRLYDFCTWLGGWALKVHPSLYKLWIGFEKLRGRLTSLGVSGILGEPKAFFTAASELEARGFVVGLPLDGRGEEGPRALEARRLGEELTKRTGLESRLVDERFTTTAAMRAVREMGGSTRGRKGDLDAVAATVLLQFALQSSERSDG